MPILSFFGKRILFVDFETYFDSKGGYGLKDVSVTEYVRDARFKPHGIGYRYMDDDKAHWVSGDHQIAAFLGSVDWSNIVVVAHNTKFDGAILAWRYSVKPYAWCDTVALAKAVLGENVSGYSLKSLAEFLGLPAKGDLTCDGILNPTAQELENLGEYCKNDVELCKGIYEKLIGLFPPNQLWHVDWTIRCFVSPLLRLDVETLTEGVKTEKARREAAIQASGLRREVLSSNKQFAEHLQSIGVEVRTKVSGRTGKTIPAFAKTDDGITALKATHPCLYAGRIASKANLLETRGEALAGVGKTGSFPFDVGFSGAVQTHRYSGGSGAGGNPQNFTRDSFLRTAVSAPEGYELVVGDFATVELRILAWLANEPKLINKLINNEDLYCDFASKFYKSTVTKENKRERNFGKAAILGLGYGMGGDKFQFSARAQYGVEISEGEAFSGVNLYRDTYFNVPKLWNAAEALIPLIASDKISCLHFAPFLKVRKNSIILPSGLAIQYPNLRSIVTYERGRKRTRWVFDKFTKKYESEPVSLYGAKMIENICQGLAGDICKEAIQRTEAGMACVGSVHDEILAVAGPTHDGCGYLKRCMEKSPSWWPAIRLKATVASGPNWAAAKS